MDHAEIWIAFGTLLIAFTAGLVSAVRYFYVALADKVSIGEYNRRHQDLEERLSRTADVSDRRIRAVERWQDIANGRSFVTDHHRGDK